MRISKKILAIALSILMAVSMMPFTAFAADATASNLQSLLNEGGDITLTENVTGSYTIPTGVTVNLDLDGHTMTASGPFFETVALTNRGTLTLSNGTIKGAGAGFYAPEEGFGDLGIINYGVATINNVSSDATIANRSTVATPSMTVNNATSTAIVGVTSENGATTVLNDVDFAGSLSAEAMDDSTIVVNSGNFNTVSYADGGTLVINGGTFNDVTPATEGDNPETVDISGGTFGSDVSQYVDSNVADVTDNNNGTYTVDIKDNYVAKVGSTYYEDFEAAVAAARTGSVKTVTVVNNVDLTQYSHWTGSGTGMHYIDITGVTVDLNGNEMTIGSRWSTLFTGTNGKIMNGTCTGTDCTKWPDYNYGLYIWGPGSGNVANSGGQHATIELENLTCNYGIHCWNADVTIKNCTSTGSDSYYAVWADENTHVTIESGTYTTNGAAVIGAARSGDGDGNISVEGGDFIVPENKDLVTVTSSQSKPENVKFSGGTANVPISQTNCANGFVPKDNGNSTYGVKTAAPEGANLTLEHSIKINVYANVDDYLPENFEEGLVLVEFTTPVASSQTAAPTTTDYDYDELQKADSGAGDFAGDYIFSYEAAPAQIAEEVTVTVKYDNEVVHTYSTSIMKYCETAIANSSDDNLVALAKAIYDYGKAANGVFSYTSASKFNLNENNYFNTTNVYDAVYDAASYYCDDDYDIEGYTYIATAVPTLRIYVNAQKAYAGYKAIIDGNEVSPKIELGLDGNPTGRICVDITGVLAEDMDYAHTVTFGSAYLTINMLNYVLAIYTGTTEDYARSIYNYHVAAEAYFGEGL